MQIGTFEVTSQYFAYFISISSLVFENDKWTFGGCLGHFNMYHHLNYDLLSAEMTPSEARLKTLSNKVRFVLFCPVLL